MTYQGMSRGMPSCRCSWTSVLPSASACHPSPIGCRVRDENAWNSTIGGPCVFIDGDRAELEASLWVVLSLTYSCSRLWAGTDGLQVGGVKIAR